MGYRDLLKGPGAVGLCDIIVLEIHEKRIKNVSMSKRDILNLLCNPFHGIMEA